MANMRKPNVKCAICSKEIYRRPYNLNLNKGKAYCNKNCFGISCRNYVKCLICGEEIPGTKHAKTCSRACANKNRIGTKYKIGRPKSKDVLKAKLIILRGGQCEVCKMDNTNILQSHHIIERAKGGTNEFENLKLLCPNCHYTIHYGDSRKMETVRLAEEIVLKTTAP